MQEYYLSTTGWCLRKRRKKKAVLAIINFLNIKV